MLRPLTLQRSILLTLAVAFWLTALGCGQTGPLIYPPESAPTEATAPSAGDAADPAQTE